jgi:hypothetical protein
VIARSWRFESSLGHHLSGTFADGMLQVGCYGTLFDLPPCSRRMRRLTRALRSWASKPFETQGKPPSSKGFLVNNNCTTPTVPPPMFFVSVASKGLSYTMSLLFATLAVRIISVASKGVRGVILSHFSKCCFQWLNMKLRSGRKI